MSKIQSPERPKPLDPASYSASEHRPTKPRAAEDLKVCSEGGVALRAVAAALLFSRRSKRGS